MIAWRRRVSGSVLQCGHGTITVENPADHRGEADVGNRLNAATARKPWRTRYSHTHATATPRLQCGHGTITVENVVDSDGAEPGNATLQCGHGTITVENQVP